MRRVRYVGWFSCGAASAVAIKLSLIKHGDLLPVYCDTGSEHPDNKRFLEDCEKWFERSIIRIRSEDYDDTWDVWTKRRYLSGLHGAPCTTELKIGPRLIFQHPNDHHFFGYTADPSDTSRAARLRANYPELSVRTPLIERSLTKSDCFNILESAGIELPAMYRLGFRNNNCIPCVKATSPAYWAMIRQHFPEQFDRMAKLSRSLGARLCRIKGKRAFIDEVPMDQKPLISGLGMNCDFLCREMER